MRAAIVLWSGEIGGAETFATELARALRHQGLDARVVFVTSAGPLEARLKTWGVPFVSFGAPRGRTVAFKARQFSRVLDDQGADVAVLCSAGWLGAAVRLG